VSDSPQATEVRMREPLILPLALTGVGVVSLFVSYVVMVGTQGGRALDGAWTDRAMPSSSSGFGRSTAVMDIMAPPHVVLACLTLLLVAVVCRQWRRATATAVGMLGLLVSARVLKALLPRPDSDALVLPNSFPSGHVAGAAAIGIALLLLSSGRWRWPALVVGAAIVTLTAASAVSLQWHRPSDALGAVLLAMIWYGVGLAVLGWGVQSSTAISDRVGRPRTLVSWDREAGRDPRMDRLVVLPRRRIEITRARRRPRPELAP
jgi:membrane-associated phospholipid phosphatase